MVYHWLLDRLLPERCALCAAPAAPGGLCPGCRRDLPWLAHACPRCARPLPPGAPSGPCGACQRQPPALDACIAALAYELPVDRMVQLLKFHGRLDLAPVLGRLLAEALAERRPPWPWPDLLLPVPLHRRRLHQRGYNQALEIARPLARRWHLALAPQRVRRCRPTPPQSGLDARARRVNLRGAFRVQGRLDGLNLALVDDVMTTGSTLDALARALRRRGARRVEAWVCARTPPPGP